MMRRDEGPSLRSMLRLPKGTDIVAELGVIMCGAGIEETTGVEPRSTNA